MKRPSTNLYARPVGENIKLEPLQIRLRFSIQDGAIHMSNAEQIEFPKPGRPGRVLAIQIEDAAGNSFETRLRSSGDLRSEDHLCIAEGELQIIGKLDDFLQPDGSPS